MKIVPNKIRTEHQSNAMGGSATETPQTHFILAEGPRLSDAEFTIRWLSTAMEADRLLQNCFSENPGFHDSVLRIECSSRIQFASSAMAFIWMWQTQKGVFLVDILDPEGAEPFCFMVGAGFFTSTGERYQMTIPNKIEIDRIKNELLRLAATEDTDYRLHPEWLLTTMSHQQAVSRKRKLKRIYWQWRVADRNALLAEIKPCAPPLDDGHTACL